MVRDVATESDSKARMMHEARLAGRPDPVRITVIDPVVLDARQPLTPVPEVDGVVVQRRSLAFGTASIESRWDDAFAAPGIIAAATRAEADGADAIVINCMDDPGLDAAREVVRIPVVAPALASMHLALCLAGRFSILTTAAEDIPVVRELVEHHRLERGLASIRAIGLPVQVLHDDAEATFARLMEAARAAVVEDGAEALIAGCTLLSGATERLSDELQRAGTRVPVIDPLAAALHLAATLVRLGISHSSIGYPTPDAKDIVWPGPGGHFGPARASVTSGTGR